MKFLKKAVLFAITVLLLLNSGCNEVKKSACFVCSENSDISSQYQSVEASSEVSSEVSSEERQEPSVVTHSTTAKPSLPASTPAPAPIPPTVPTASNPGNEIKAVWISFLEFSSILKGKSETQFTSSIRKYFNQCVDYGLNTVIVQVRSHSDALYRSSLFPASVYFTGNRQNTFPFDPLSIMVREAHERRLRIEAWVNPYRGNEINMTFADNDPVKNWLGTDKVFQFSNNGYTYYGLNPGEPEVRNLVIQGIVEILNGYDVDGIHLDDYFYPNITPDKDANTYNTYGQGMDLLSFRKKSVNELVSSIYREVNARGKIFGISPQGNIENCLNSGADVELWGSTQGYVDYLAPQLYWAYGEGKLPYDLALSKWKALVTNTSVKLLVGLAPYKVGKNANWSEGNVIARQVADGRNVSNYGGFILFRYDLFFKTGLETERANLKAIL